MNTEENSLSVKLEKRTFRFFVCVLGVIVCLYGSFCLFCFTPRAVYTYRLVERKWNCKTEVASVETSTAICQNGLGRAVLSMGKNALTVVMKF